MNSTHIIGIDLAKHVFHLVGHDCSGRETFRKKLTRQKTLQLLSAHEPVIVAMEACGGCHWFARKCQGYGHQVKLLPAQYVKPYVKTHKNDFIDADAIAEAAINDCVDNDTPAQACSFHHPLHAQEWGDEQIKEDFEHLFVLLEKAISK